jgi:hypothetical protein
MMEWCGQDASKKFKDSRITVVRGKNKGEGQK